MIGPSGLLRASRIVFASTTGSFAILLKMYAASFNSASSASLFAPNIPHSADFSALFTTLFIASYLADFPFSSKSFFGAPPFEGAADGVDFGVLGVASPVGLTLGLGRIGSEKKEAGTGFFIVLDQNTAKIDNTLYQYEYMRE